MKPWLALLVLLLPSVTWADDRRGCYMERQALEILSDMGAATTEIGLGGKAAGTPEWWITPGGGWVLVMVIDARGSRCIVDHGPRSYRPVEPQSAYGLLETLKKYPREGRVIR